MFFNLFNLLYIYHYLSLCFSLSLSPPSGFLSGQDLQRSWVLWWKLRRWNSLLLSGPVCLQVQFNRRFGYDSCHTKTSHVWLTCTESWSSEAGRFYTAELCWRKKLAQCSSVTFSLSNVFLSLCLCCWVFRWSNSLQQELCFSYSGRLSPGGQKHQLLSLIPQQPDLQRSDGRVDPHGDLQFQQQQHLRGCDHGGFSPPPVYPYQEAKQDVWLELLESLCGLGPSVFLVMSVIPDVSYKHTITIKTHNLKLKCIKSIWICKKLVQ